VYLVKDIYTDVGSPGGVPVGGGPGGPPGARGVVAGDTMFFPAATETTGTELWRTDGTPEDTALVRDLAAGTGTSRPSPVVAGGQLFLWASDGTDDALSLWKSDGTYDGTTLLADVEPGRSSVATGDEIVAIGGSYFFPVYRSDLGYELWVSDGTPAGTHLVKDIVPGPGASFPRNLTASGSTLFFFAEDGVHGRELWKSDGSEVGTVLVADIRPGSESSAAGSEYMRAFAGGVLFLVDDGVHGYELWKSDGTEAGTALVKDVYPGPVSGGPPSPPVDAGGTLLFQGTDPEHGAELWRTDGTEAGTQLVVDLEPGTRSSSPGVQVAVANTALFFAQTSASGTALWKSDGTAAGTALVRDLWPDNCVQFFSQNLTPAATLLYFTAPTCLGQSQVWRSDGLPDGTFPVADLDVNSTLMGAIGDRLLYSDAYGRLWTTDGTVASTALVSDFGPQTGSALPGGGLDMAGTLFFAATAPGPPGRGLWKSDGTASSTVQISSAGSPQQLTRFDATRFFFTAANVLGRELWLSDGTTAGTRMVKDIYPPSPGSTGGSGLSTTQPLTVVRGRLYFVGQTATYGRELWISDGTAAGTQMVKDIRPGSASSDIRGIAKLGGTLIFMADDGTHGLELWRSDGTEAGTQMVKDIWPGSTDGSSGTPVQLGVFLYFTANDGAGYGLWKTDGTTAGTQRVAAVGYIPEIVRVGNALYFVVSSGLGGVWKSDGTTRGTYEIPGTHGLLPTGLRAVGRRVAFSGKDDVHGRELWTSDGTAAGTTRIDLWPGPGSSVGFPNDPLAPPRTFETIGDLLVFSGYDGVSGGELWVSDGTPGGTRRVSDLAVPGGSDPREIVASGDLVYFSALQMGPGRELFAVPRAALEPDQQGPVDSDHDGLDDDAELRYGTNPLVADTDGDRLDDGVEVHVYGTDPLKGDTDGDGSSDGREIDELHTDPLDPSEGGVPPQVPALDPLGAVMLATLLAAGAKRAVRLRC